VDDNSFKLLMFLLYPLFILGMVYFFLSLLCVILKSLASSIKNKEVEKKYEPFEPKWRN